MHADQESPESRVIADIAVDRETQNLTTHCTDQTHTTLLDRSAAKRGRSASAQIVDQFCLLGYYQLKPVMVHCMA
jgi:hypothetical protein